MRCCGRFVERRRDALPRLYLAGAEVVGPLAVAWCSRRLPLAVQCSLVMAAAILLAPICWTSYLPLLLCALALGLRRLAREWEAADPADAPLGSADRVAHDVH